MRTNVDMSYQNTGDQEVTAGGTCGEYIVLPSDVVVPVRVRNNHFK